MVSWGGAEDANVLGNLGGTLGITDPNKGNRALSTMQQGQQQANDQLDADTAEQFGMLRDAMGSGRTLGQNLDTFDSSMAGAQDKTNTAGDIMLGQQNAGSADNVQQYLNPEMDMILSNTMQRMQGGAGSALQSSATNRNTASAVASKAGDLWQQAYSNAMGDAQNNLQVANQYQNNAGQNAQLATTQLQADNAPAEDYLQLANDKAMQRYAGNVALTQAAGQNAGRDQSLLGSLLGGS